MPLDLWFAEEIEDIVSAIELPVSEVLKLIDDNPEVETPAEAYVAGYRAALESIVQYLGMRWEYESETAPPEQKEDSHDPVRVVDGKREQPGDRARKTVRRRDVGGSTRLAA